MKQFIFIALIAALGLSACTPAYRLYNNTETRVKMAVDPGQTLLNHNRCPGVMVMEDLSFYHDYLPFKPRTPENLKSRATLSKSASSCDYEDKTVTVDATLNFEGTLGARSRLKSSDDPLFSYPFFVAITDKSGSILAKQIFSASIHYPQLSNVGTYQETIRQVIPLDNTNQAKDYIIITGFQLTEEQLAENRALIATAKEEARKAAAAAKNNPPAASQAEDMGTSTHSEEILIEEIPASEIDSLSAEPSTPAATQPNSSNQPITLVPDYQS